MARMPSGLILTPHLTQRNVTIDLHFRPSVGILARRVDKLGADIRSFREPLRKAVKEVMIPSIRKNFDTRGRPPWEPLALGTVAQKGNDKPLVTTGRLRRQMGYINIWTIDREKALISDLPDAIWYGKIHQGGAQFSLRGGTGPQNLDAIRKALSFSKKHTGSSSSFGTKGSIPARPFVVMQKEDEIAIERIFQEWVGDRVRRSGLG